MKWPELTIRLWAGVCGYTLQSHDNEPFLALPDILTPTVAFGSPRSPLPVRIHLEYLINRQTLRGHYLLEEWRDFCAASVESRNTIYSCVGRVGEEVQHGFGEVFVLPWHPETICCEDTSVAMCVL